MLQSQVNFFCCVLFFSGDVHSERPRTCLSASIANLMSAFIAKEAVQ